MVVMALSGGCDRPPEALPDSDPRPWASSGSWFEVELEAVSDDTVGISYASGLAVDSNGRVYVRDASRRDVIVLGSGLELTAVVGREGDGPGEFRSVSRIHVLPGDSLWVHDGAREQVSVFAPESHELVYTRRLSPSGDRHVGRWRLTRFQGMNRYLATFRHAYQARESSQSADINTSMFVTVDSVGQIVHDSILVAPSSEDLVLRSGGSMSMMLHPFSPGLLYSTLSGGRLVYASSRALDLRILDTRGQKVGAISYPTTPVAVTAAELQAEIDRAPDFESLLREGAPYTWPVLTGLVVDDEDRIWVGIRSSLDDAHWEWAAFTQDGAHHGSVRLPEEFRLRAIQGDKLFGFLTDALDVPRVYAYRMFRP